MPIRLILFATAGLAVGLVLAGCGSSRTDYASDEATANVGVYTPPPAGVDRLKVGVPPFVIKDEDLAKDTASVAADQATTLMILTQRFDVIERAQLEQLLNEQGLEGIVRVEEAAAVGQVRGVDALLLGKITNWSVKKSKSKGGFGLVNVGGVIGGADISKSNVKITVEIGVDLRLVDPSSGSIKAAHFGEFIRTDKASGFGVQILGASADGDADLEIDEDNAGKLLRLALDDAVKKMMPQVDTWLIQRSRE